MAAATRAPLEPLTAEPIELFEDGAEPARPEVPARPAEPARPAVPSAAGTEGAPSATAAPAMDRDFIARNQIVERYLSGKLPLRGATEFERFCKANPELLDEMGIPERVNAALRLLEAGGQPEPWREHPKRFWEKPLFAAGLGLAVVLLLITSIELAQSRAAESRTVATLTREVAAQPLEPAATTRTIRLLPSHEGPSRTPVVVIGGDDGEAQLADLLLDLTRSPYHQYRVTIDRIGEGRVAIINDLAKDSNGHLRIALNSSALGPGDYEFTIEGLTWRGDPVPDSWVTLGIRH